MLFAERTRSRLSGHGSMRAAAIAALVLLPVTYVLAAGRQTLNGQVPEAVSASKAIGRVPAGTRIRLAIGLPLRNAGELDTLINELSDPASPNFRRYLTPAQFAERFGPPEEDYRTLTEFFQSNGFSITGTHPNRTILDVSGTADQIERTFQVNMMYWNHPARGTFFAPDREPSVDAGVTILDVTGLDNFVLPRPMSLNAHALAASADVTTGSGPEGLFIGNDFRAAYAPGVTLNGAGQNIGLFELDGFYSSDVQANFQQAGLSPVPTQTVLLDGFNGAPGSANIEVVLDIMMAAYMAPGASKIFVYEGTNWNDVLNRMATDDVASQLSSSWSFSPTNPTTEQIFRQMIAQGQSLFQASGDSGAYRGAVASPSDDPNLTVVGGTSLTTSGPGGPWQSESTWSYSGGGVSTVWTIPSYQQSLNMTQLGGSSTMRNIPDVALIADEQLFLICNNGQWMEVGGTSAAAPLWAGFVALANQQAAANGKSPVGFLNPAIYAIGTGSGYQNDLHDVTIGNNGGFSALPGYDLATGWGTPSGQPLIDALTGTAAAPGFSLSSSVPTLSIAQGTSGVSTITVSDQAGFSGAVNLSALGLPSGVTASFSPSSASTTSTLTLIAGASAAPGSSVITINGASGNLTSSTRLALTVTGTAPPFSIAAAPATVSLTRASATTSTLTIARQSGFNGAVSLTVSGLPGGVGASFSGTNSATSRILTLTASAAAALGTFPVTITGASGNARSATTLNLTVSGGTGFSIVASPANLNILAGTTGVSTITVAPQPGFSGTVSLSIAGLPPGASAKFSPAATTRVSTLTVAVAANVAPGTSTLTITGTSGASTSSAKIALNISAPASFTLSATPANVSLTAGGSAASVLTVIPQNGFNASVALSASGLPAGVTATFSPASTTHTSTITFKAAANAPATTVTVSIAGLSGALNSKTPIALTIVRPATFTLSAAPSSLSVAPGGSSKSTLTLTPQNGFKSAVTLTISGLPNGVAGSFSAGSTPSTCVLTLTAASSAAAGSATVTVTGKSGSLVETAAIALTVQTPPGANTMVSLTSSYNVVGLVRDGATFQSGSGLDAGGRAYSANLLSAGAVNATDFHFGPADAAGAVSSATIALPAGKFASLRLLATGVNGNQKSQTFTVTYTDGTKSTFTQSLSDWCTPQGYAGESSALDMAYRDNSDGTRDSRAVRLYGYTFNLSTGKTVKSLTLPGNRNVIVLAINLNAASSSTAASLLNVAPSPGRTQFVLYPGSLERIKR